MKVQPTTKELIAMLYERLPELFDRAAPVQEPVGYWLIGTEVVEFGYSSYHDGSEWTPIYTTPPAQPAPVQPVAWRWVNPKGWLTYGEAPHDTFKSTPLYTTQPAQPAPVQEHEPENEPFVSLASVREDWGPGPHEVHSLPPAAPVQEPVAIRNAIVVSLLREGINKHRARELADHFIGLATLPAHQEAQAEETVKERTPQERRDAGESYCPECFTFGHQHRRGCTAAHGIKENT